VALTAFAQQSYRDRGLASGMTDYLSKPIRAVDLAAAIERNALTSAGTAEVETGKTEVKIEAKASDEKAAGEYTTVFNIDLEPASGASRYSVQFKREFFAD
jgi:CheY-like chemotaxis protein